MNTNDKHSFLKIRGQNITTLYSFPITYEYKKDALKQETPDKISIVFDDMFHALFNHPGRIKFPARLLSYILDIPFETLMSNLKLTSSDVPKENRKSIGQRSDLVCELENSVITIEMNNNPSIEIMHRNMDYMFKQYNSKVKDSKSYDKYWQSILFNLNNFAFEGVEGVYTISYLKDENGIVLTDKIIIINIYIPNLLKKCYTHGIKSLDEFEKFIYAVIEDNEKNLEDLIKEMPMLEEYVDEARYASKSDDELLFAYDHEKANNDQYFTDGFNDGIQKGKEEMIKSMYENNIPIDIIAKSANLNIEKIKEILDIK